MSGTLGRWRGKPHASSGARWRATRWRRDNASSTSPARPSPTSVGRSRRTRSSRRRPMSPAPRSTTTSTPSSRCIGLCYDDAEERVSAEFGVAAATSDTFVGQFEASPRAGVRDELARPIARSLPRVLTRRHEPSSRAAKGDSSVGGGRDRVGSVKTGLATGEIPPSAQEAGERARAGDPGRAERRGVRRSHAAASGDRRRPRPPRGQPARSVVAQRAETSSAVEEVIV